MKTINVKSNSGNTYSIDLDEITCSCADFRYRRSYASKYSSNRLCKHLQSVKDQLRFPQLEDGRFPYEVASKLVYEIQSKILSSNALKYEATGSFRRLKETIGDIDFLITGDLDKIADAVESTYYIKPLWRGSIKASYIIKGIQVDFMKTEDKYWPFALLHFTGSKYHNIKLRKLAKSKGVSLSEYGFDEDPMGFKSEKEIFDYLGIEYVFPQDR